MRFRLVRIFKYTVWKVIFYNLNCQNFPLSINEMFVIDHKENVYLINNKIVCNLTRTSFFVINHNRFCYYSVACQNVQWLIVEKYGCWVEYRAAVFGAGTVRFKYSTAMFNFFKINLLCKKTIIYFLLKKYES